MSVRVLAFALCSVSVATAVLADREQGREVFFAECVACHAIGCDRAGPRLGGVIGRQAGSVADYPYSDAMRSADFVWSRETLDAFIADPETVVPGNGMAGAAGRLENATARSHLLDFLEEPDDSLDLCF